MGGVSTQSDFRNTFSGGLGAMRALIESEDLIYNALTMRFLLELVVNLNGFARKWFGALVLGEISFGFQHPVGLLLALHIEQSHHG